jgi:hypothetical protein
MEGRVSLFSDSRGTTRLIHPSKLKRTPTAMNLLLRSAQLPVLPQLTLPLLERSKVMASSMRFEPVPILLEVLLVASATGQNLRW